MTVQVTIVVPLAITEGALLPTLLTPQLSAVVGVPKLTPFAEQPIVLAFTVISAGAVIVGFSLS